MTMYVIKSTGRDGVKPFETKILDTGFKTEERAIEWLKQRENTELDMYNINGVKTLYNKTTSFLFEIIKVNYDIRKN